MHFWITICKISSEFRYFGMDHIVLAHFSSQCAIKPHSPFSTKPNPKKVEKYPPSLGSYNDSQARHSTNYQQISAEDTARSPPTQHISEKSICIAYPDKYRKRHSYSLPRYSGLYCISE